MLLSFRFSNHRSFRDEQQLNLTPVYAADDHAPGPAAVPVAGIFGANASGKSNALDALAFMRHLVLRSDRDVEPGGELVRFPFRLDDDPSASPSSYVVDLLLNGARLTFGVEIDDRQVRREWLYQYTSPNRYREIFDRQESVKLGDSVRKADLAKISEITAPTALFLSTVARFGRAEAEAPAAEEPMHSVYRWFSGIRGPGRRPAQLIIPRPEHDWQIVASLVRAADVGITDMRQRAPELPVDDSFESTDLSNIRRFLGGAPPRAREQFEFLHRGPAGRETAFSIDEESSGTRQLFALAVDVSTLLAEKGTMLVDEIDASLHPMLTARLITLFQSSRSNRAGSQLIFTTHDATLLGNFDGEEVLGRDQIWFTEKDEEGASRLYPLSDFKPRKEGENRQRRYLNGSYGGVPDLAWDIFEQALAARGDLRDR